LFAELDEVAVNVAERGAFFGLPIDGQLVEKGRVAGFGRVADFHAVVKQGNPVNCKHQHRGGEGTANAETGDGASFVMVVGDAHVEGAFWKLAGVFLPGAAKVGRRRAMDQNIVQSGKERP
jgi:hypothetical protein